MTTQRIFISSPGDVGEERVIAQRVIKRLQEEFAGHISLEPMFWEHEPLLAVTSFQEQLPRPSEAADICIFILWSRLGTPLPENITRPDGSRYASGTEFEFEDAINGYREKGIPDLLVYRKTAELVISLKSKKQVLERVTQQEAVEAFMKKWFESTDGASFTAAFHTFDTPAQFEERLEVHLRKQIAKFLSKSSGADQQIRSRAVWKESPFRGLQFFDFQHALIFCGRTQAVSEVITLLRNQADDGRAFVLVLGTSGAGKSSLVRAGVLPTLTRPRVIESIDVWRQTIMRPSDASGDLFEGLAIALLRDKSLPELAETGTPTDELARLLRQTPEAAVTLLKAALSQVAAKVQRKEHIPKELKARLLVVVDQMEEIFTLERVTPDERRDFVVALSVLARSGCVWIIATMRSDFYSRCAEVPEFLNLKGGLGQYDLKPPTPAEISQMIRKPARIAGLRFEEDPKTEVGLDEVLRDAAVRDPEVLPLLEFTLEELYKQCTEQGGVLTHGAYQALGGIEGALAKRAEEEFKRLEPGVQAVLPSVLSCLISLEVNGDTATRRRVPIDAVATKLESELLIKAFVNARLFVTDRTDDGTAVVSVAHEALLRRWPRLQNWIIENKDFLRTRARIAGAAALWHDEGKRVDYLLSEGKPLGEGKALLVKRRKYLSPEEIKYIEASIREATHKHRLRIGSMAVVVVLATVGYLAIADAGVDLPKGEGIRMFLDRHEVSLSRPLYSEVEVRRAAAAQRLVLLKAFQRGRRDNLWIPVTLNPNEEPLTEVWAHSQSLCALFRTPDADEQELRTFLNGFEAPFASGVTIEKKGITYGWISHPGATDTIAEPALWTAAALAAALGRSQLLDKQQQQDLMRRFAYTQEILKAYRPLETGGWNMFINQKDPALHVDSSQQIFDGLTLQIYSLLLRAEAEADFDIPSVILDQIPRHLTTCIKRDLTFPVSSGEFRTLYAHPNSAGDYAGNESVGFLWYPWAIDCAVRWLQRAEKYDAPKEHIIQVRRALGHLVVDLGEDSAKKASSDSTFIAAETLYGLSAIPSP